MKAKTPSARRPSKKGTSNRPVTPPAVHQRSSKPDASSSDNAQRNRAKSTNKSFVSRVDAKRAAEVRKANKPQTTLPRKAKSNSITDLDGLYSAWLDEPIMQDWFELTQALDQIKDGRTEEAMLPTAFLQRIRIDLTTLPHCLPSVNEAWNQFCDRVGWPQEKKNAPGPEEPRHPEGTTDEPF